MVQTRAHDYAPKPFSQQPLASAAARHVEETRISVKRLRKLRARRLHQSILGPKPTFRGKVTISRHFEAREPDSIRLMNDDDNIALGNTLVYWADGSYAFSGPYAGFLGAGVAWLEGNDYCCQTYELGRYTGNNEDAEIFAIAAALAKAKNEVWESLEILLVKIYSDAMGVLQALQHGTPCRVGPMLSDAKTALQAIYERAEWLTAKGVEVELIWVKGHSTSKGNQMADEAAFLAVSDQGNRPDPVDSQPDSNSGSKMTTADVPEPWKHMGPDWVEEWLSRANAQNTKERIAYPRFMDMDAILDYDLPLTGGLPYDDEDSSRGGQEGDRAAAQDGIDQLLSRAIHRSAKDEPHVQKAEVSIEHAFPPLKSLPENQQDLDDGLHDDNRPDDNKEREHEQSPTIDRFAFSVPGLAFSISDLSQYSNITVEQAIEDLRAKLSFKNAHISYLEERVVDGDGRWRPGLVRAALERLDMERDQILSSLRAYEAKLKSQGTDKVDKSPLLRETSSTFAARSTISAHQAKEESDDVDIYAPGAEPNPLIPAGSTISSHQSKEEHDEVSKGTLDDETRSTFVARAMSKLHLSSTLNDHSTFSSRLSKGTSNVEDKNALVENNNPFLADCALFSSRRPDEKSDKVDKSALVTETSSGLVARSVVPSSSQKRGDDSDEDGTQDEIDKQIENDILLAQRHVTCKP